MCLCVLLYKQVPGYPLVMAANREERYDRPSQPPSWVARDPAVFAGRDERSGGTWQGTNQFGLLLALTNRVSSSFDPQRRSRGLLCMDALRHTTARETIEWVLQHLESQAYNPYNLICADAHQAFVLHFAGQAQVSDLQPGLHVLADTDMDDGRHPRVLRTRALLQEKSWESWPASRTALGQLMADHAESGGPDQQLCRHGAQNGTVSSSLIALKPDSLEGAQFLFAPGPPCTHPYEDLSAQLQTLPARR